MTFAASRRYWILVVVCLMYVLSFFHRVCPTVIAVDLMRSLDLTPARLSLLSLTTMAAYGVVQMPAGMIGDVYGPRRTVTVFMTGSALCAMWFGLSTSFSAAVSARLLLGLMLAVSVPSLALLASWFPASQYGRVSSVLLCCGGLGGILAAPPLVWLSNTFGWRHSILLFAGLTLLLAVVAWFVIRDTPKPSLTRAPAASLGENMRRMWQGAGQVMRTRAFYPPTLWIMCMTGMFFAMSSLWWGPYFMQGCGFSKEQTGVLLTSISLALLVGQPTAGYLSDAVFKSRKKPILYASLLALCTSVPFALYAGQLSFNAMLALCVAFAFGVSCAPPVLFTNIKELFPLSLTGTAIGCGNMFFPLWAAGLQYVFGRVVEHELGTGTGPAQAYGHAAWLLVGCSVIGLCCALRMKETYGTQAVSEKHV